MGRADHLEWAWKAGGPAIRGIQESRYSALSGLRGARRSRWLRRHEEGVCWCRSMHQHQEETQEETYRQSLFRNNVGGLRLELWGDPRKCE